MLWICDVLLLVTVYPQKKGIMKQVIYTVYYSVCFAIKLHPLNLIVVQTQSDISLCYKKEKEWHKSGAWTKRLNYYYSESRKCHH